MFDNRYVTYPLDLQFMEDGVLMGGIQASISSSPKFPAKSSPTAKQTLCTSNSRTQTSTHTSSSTSAPASP